MPRAEWEEFENLAWSITLELKDRTSLTEYEPREDPGVRAVLDALERLER